MKFNLMASLSRNTTRANIQQQNVSQYSRLPTVSITLLIGLDCDQMKNKGAFIRFQGAEMKPNITSFMWVEHPTSRPMQYAQGWGSFFWIHSLKYVNSIFKLIEALSHPILYPTALFDLRQWEEAPGLLLFPTCFLPNFFCKVWQSTGQSGTSSKYSCLLKAPSQLTPLSRSILPTTTYLLS